MFLCVFVYMYMVAQIFQNSGNDLKILDAIRVT
jgi:hypothetical protein